jgi:tetratricopeptide (TPR) repeat protein
MKIAETIDEYISNLTGRFLLHIVLLIVISSAVYLNTLSHDFVFDDMDIIVENKYISDFSKNFPAFFNKTYFKISGGEASYRPVATLSYFLIYAIAKLNPVAYHISSLLLHSINVILVYWLMNLIQRSKFSSLIAGLIFATHPVLTEAVNCVSFNEDLLTTLFFLLSLSLYIKSKAADKTLGIPLCILSLLAFLLALLSKEMAITLPGMIVLYDLTFTDAENEKILSMRSVKILKNGIPYYSGFMAISLFYLYLRFHIFYNQKELSVHSYGSFLERLLFLPQQIFGFIKIAFYPLNLSAHYVFSYPKSFFEISNILAILFFSGLVVASFFIVKKSKVTFFGIWWFFIALFPVSNIIEIFNPIADRYLYLPLIGFCMVMSIFITDILPRILSPRINRFNTLKLLIVVGLLIFYSAITVTRNNDWKDNFTLFSKTLENSPDSPIAHGGLGLAYQEQGRLEDAIREFKKTIELMPGLYKAYFSLAYAYEKQGLIDEAIHNYMKVVEINPNYVDAYYNLANLFIKRGLLTQAAGAYTKIIKLEPKDFEARNNLGVVYAMQGKLDAAIQEWEQVLKIDPKNQKAIDNIEKARNMIN